ncbi:alpha/beta fold hydrolase [Nocardia sp. NPDC003482]
MNVTLAEFGSTTVTYTDQGSGAPVLLLHGGAGPASVAEFATLLADRPGLRVITPVHPGFDGTPRPPELTDIPGLARLYAALLAELGLTEVTVVGNSIGGWIAAELALLRDPRVARLVLVDAVGLDLPQTPIVDFFALDLDRIADLSYRDPDAHRIGIDSLAPHRLATMAANRATLREYGGTTMSDPTLLTRLPEIPVPTLVIWGAHDGIVPPDHGHAYTTAIPSAEFHLLPDAGHLPQLETPTALAELIAAATAKA